MDSDKPKSFSFKKKSEMSSKGKQKEEVTDIVVDVINKWREEEVLNKKEDPNVIKWIQPTT